MTNREQMKTASNVAETVYMRFLEGVVEKNVICDREDKSVGEQTRKKIEAGTYADPRAVRLMTISGKGGYSPDPERQKVYAGFYNVTLLDHLLSVTRGALVLTALDMTTRNPEISRDILEKWLAVTASVSFLHDTDKDLKLKRNEPLEVEVVAERMERYGITDFLERAGAPLAADQIRYLIEKVESTQAHRHAPVELPPREFEPLPLYVRLADKLDGAWLSADAETGGMNGVIKRIREDRSCLGGDLLKQWKEVRLFDPHHPFLLDELQRCLSMISIRETGIPPLIEVHQDGHLFMLLPSEGYETIVARSLAMLVRRLPFGLKLDVSNRGIPALYNGRPSHDELTEFVGKLSQKELGDLFKIKNELMAELGTSLDDMLSESGLQPKWPGKSPGALVTLYASLDEEKAESEWLRRAAHLVMLLNLKVDAKPKDGVPDSSAREKQLLDTIGEIPPDWILGIADDASRRTITALWSVSLAERDDDVLETIWGDGGLLQKWLEGADDAPGFNRFFSGAGSTIPQSLIRRFGDLLSGKRVDAEIKGAEGRCLFTDEPVPFNRTIDQALGLYGVRVSAFSGRDGRPEMLTSAKAHTNVGNSSIAEHTLRAEAHAEQGGRAEGVPALVSSPTTSGLFGGLAITDDRAMGAMSVYDLSRLEMKKGKVLKGMEMYQGRFRMARLERMPESLEGQVNIIRMMMNATRRIGRPIHIFRGLPTLRRSYFHFDAMPRTVEELVGGRDLFLEQIPDALFLLEIAQKLLETNGLGHDVLKLYANPQTRFGAMCLACCQVRDAEDKSGLALNLERQYADYMEDKTKMNEKDGALVRLGQAAAGIQKNPGGVAAAGEELMVFKLCLDAANETRRAGQTDEKSMVYAVAGELETNLVRRDKAAARKWREGKSLSDACLEVAELFVKEVWLGVMNGKSPGQKTRRILSSIYRMAFLRTFRDRYEDKKPE